MDWLDTLKAIAPTVATALGSPLAGAAVAALGSIFSINEPTQDKISKLFADGQLTPDHLAAIRELELKYQNDEKERGFKYAELAYKDVDSARQMQIAVKSRTPEFLSWAIILGGGYMIFAVLQGWAKADSVLAGTLIGYAVSEMKQVLQYWFGSSVGSKDKDDTLSSIAKGQ